MTKNIIGNRFEKQDAEAFKVLQSMLKRPGMYVGEARFDYIDFLFSGYCWGRKSEINILPNKEIQYWLLHTQSASLHGTISGAELFYRCFGLRNIAFENYKVFLDASIPQDFEGIDDELHMYEKKHNTVRYDWEDDVPSDHYQKLAQAVYINIQEMISRTGLLYDKIKIYIHKERLFNQVRFLFHGNDGWVDDSQIIIKPEYHEILIAIHANVRNANAEDLRNCGYEVFDNIDDKNDILTPHDMFTDEMTFLSEFTRWKEKIVGQVT